MNSPIGTPAHINESTKSIILEAKQPTAKIVRSDFSREQPEHVTFEKLIQMHDRTPQIQVAVSGYSEMITGTELLINTKSSKAQQFIEEWLVRTNFYDKFESIVNTILITGNGLLEKLDENNIEDVEEVDMSTIISKKRNEYGELEWYEHRTQNGNIDKLGEGKLGKFIEFNLSNVSKQAWGRSLFYSLAIPRTIGNRTAPPLVESLWAIEDAMAAIYSNNAYPITTITYPGANDTYLEKEARKWKEYKPGDKRIQKIKPEIEFFEVSGSQSRFTEIVEHIEKTIELGTGFPHDILTGDFTSRASSETTENIIMKKVRGYQRYISNKLKQELFNPLLAQNGFDPDKENLELSFTAQNVIELEPAQVMDMVDKGIMTKMEGRDWFRNNAGMELKEDNEIIAQQQQIDMAKQTQNQIESIQEKLRIREKEIEKKDKMRLTKQILREIDKL